VERFLRVKAKGMRDKSLDIFLMVLFGIGGIIILVLAWLQPMPLTDRIVTTSIGSIGIVWVLIRARVLKPVPTEAVIETNDSHDAAEESV
jgi:polyferredoxin